MGRLELSVTGSAKKSEGFGQLATMLIAGLGAIGILFGIGMAFVGNG